MSRQLGKNVIIGAGIVLAAAAGLGPAHAADIPASKSTQAVLKPGLAGVRNVFEKKDDSDWYRVNLKAGNNYAFDVHPFDDHACARLNLRDENGKVLRSVFGTGGNDDGFEFRPARARTLFAEVKDCSSGGIVPPPYPNSYFVRVATDARHDMTTKAVLEVGQTIKGLLSYRADVDYFRVQLDSGKRYTLALTRADEPDLSLVDAQGKVLYRASDGSGAISGFAVPKSGTYYVRATNYSADYGFTYTLSLTSP